MQIDLTVVEDLMTDLRHLRDPVRRHEKLEELLVELDTGNIVEVLREVKVKAEARRKG